jgi:hypothetical protein
MLPELFSIAILALVCVAPAGAVDTVWNGNADTNFFNDANWSATAPDTVLEYAVIDSTDPNHVAIIDAGTGNVDLDGVNLGEFSGGGKVIQNGGTLNFDAFTTTKIGGNGSLPSTWVMNNNSVLLYDGPLNGGGAGYGFDGLSGADFDVGNGASLATFELHDTAILRIADDMKISDNGSPVGGHVLLDGDSQITVGSGTSLGSNGPGSLTVAGNALYVSGNSAGPGNTANGYTNEGYLTAHQGSVVVKDNGRLWIRTLQNRGNEMLFTLQDNGRFDIFDVFFHASPVLGTSTVGARPGSSVNGNERTSEFAENPGSRAVVTIKNNAVMTVDSNVPDGSWSGLALSGGSNRGGNAGGGETLIDIQDQGSFIVQQDLHMTLGFDAAANSTLKVRGPDATVTVNGNLRMALDEFGVQNPGTATLQAVITASTHTTINVGGSVNIDNGNLVVELDGYTPVGGESYELIAAGSVIGSAFENEDFSLAPLASELSWEVAVSGNSVFLNVLGSTGPLGDTDGDQDVDGSDFLAIQRGFGGTFNAGSFADWATNFGTTPSVAAAAAVPEPSALLLVLLTAGTLGGVARRR